MPKTSQLHIALDQIEDDAVREALQSVVIFCNNLVSKGLDTQARVSAKTMENRDRRFVVDSVGQVTAKAFATYGSGALQGATGTGEVPTFWRTSVREGWLAASATLSMLVDGRVLGAVGFMGTFAQAFTFTDTDVDIAANTITEAAHGLTDGDQITFLGPDALLPAPLVQGTLYYVVSAAANTFKLALTVGGAAIDITTVGGIAAVHSVRTGLTSMQVIPASVDDPAGPDTDEDVIYFTSGPSGGVTIYNGDEDNIWFYRVLIFYTDDLT